MLSIFICVDLFPVSGIMYLNKSNTAMDQYKLLLDGFITLQDDKLRLGQLEDLINLLEARPCNLDMLEEDKFHLFNYMVRETIGYIEKEKLKDKATYILEHGITLLKPEYIKRLEKLARSNTSLLNKIINLFRLPSV